MKILKMLEKMVVRMDVRKVPMFISEGNGDDDGGKDGGNVLIVSLHFHPPILIKQYKDLTLRKGKSNLLENETKLEIFFIQEGGGEFVQNIRKIESREKKVFDTFNFQLKEGMDMKVSQRNGGET